MKLLLLAGAGLTAAALPFSSAAQSPESDGNSVVRAVAASAQDDVEDIILRLRLRYSDLEREAELMEARMELEALERRQELALASREQIRELRAQRDRLDADLMALEERAEHVSSETDRRLEVAIVEAEAEANERAAAMRAEIRAEFEARRTDFADQQLELRRALAAAVKEEDDELVMTLETRLESLATSLHEAEQGAEERFEHAVSRQRAEREAELVRMREALEAEAMERRSEMRRNAREVEMMQRELDERSEDLDLRAQYEEQRLRLRSELEMRERRMALHAEMERIEMEIERAHLARDRSAHEGDGDDPGAGPEEALADVWQAIGELREEVAELEDEVEKLKGDAERFR